MKKIFTLLCGMGIFTLAIAQTASTKWLLSTQSTRSFIENKSQFDKKNQRPEDKTPGAPVLFAADMGATQIYFSKTGLTYRFDKKDRKTESESVKERKRELSKKSYAEREKEERAMVVTTDMVNMVWVGANPSAEVIGLDPTPDYYNYANGANGINNVSAFRKLVYKNLYPNVDVEYTFHSQGGIEYVLNLHPGADVSQIKLQYDSKVSLDIDGNIHLNTLFGDIIDHAPSTFYASGNSPIESHFVRSGKVVSFALSQYDNTREVVIDPWTITPSMPNSNKIWEIESDDAGNAYIYGGDSPFRMQKYNSSGALQWTYVNGWDSSTTWVGTLLTDPSTGISYLSAGSTARLAKVSAAGGQLYNVAGGAFDEYWGLTFNCDRTKLICGGTRLVGLFSPTGDGKIFDINMNTGGVNSSITVAKAIPSFIINDINEVRSICYSPNGNYYFHTLDTVGSMTSALSINYRLLTSYSYAYGSPDYGFTPQPQHTIKATGSYIYTLNGKYLFRRDISTGAVIDSVAVPTGNYSGPSIVQGIAPSNGGIDIDSCGYIYVGGQSAISKFDGSLNFINSITTPNVVYDLAVAPNGEIMACGQGFAGSFAGLSSCAIRSYICVTSVPPTVSTTNVGTACNGDCNGIAIANAGSGTPPYTYNWSPSSATTSTVSTLCAGSYTATVTDANGLTATSITTITQPPALTTSTGTQDATCSTCPDGSAWVTASGGTGAYTYEWNTSPVQTGATATGLLAGCYTATVTDANGCSTSTEVCVVTVPLNVTTDNTPPPCAGGCNGIARATPVNGMPPYSYDWSPGGATTQTVSALCAGNYTVTVTDVNSVTAVSITTITQPTVLTITVGSQNASCATCPDGFAWAAGGGGTPPYDYEWGTNPIQSTDTAVNLLPGTYFVCVDDVNSCKACTTITVDYTVGMSSIAMQGGFSIYPNPSDGRVTLISANTSVTITSIEITDVTGRLIEERGNLFNSEIELDLTAYSKGMYFIKVGLGDKVLQRKIMIE
jgi:hypothetical protein